MSGPGVFLAEDGTADGYLCLDAMDTSMSIASKDAKIMPEDKGQVEGARFSGLKYKISRIEPVRLAWGLNTAST